MGEMANGLRVGLAARVFAVGISAVAVVVGLGGCAMGKTNENRVAGFEMPVLGPIPETGGGVAVVNEIPLAEWASPAAAREEVKLDLAIAAGPYEPTWESIEANYPGVPGWLREAKFGIWVHFGPQAAGKSGDWYARKMYVEGTEANKRHLAEVGHPSEVGYKEVLRDWNPTKLDPKKLVEIYKDAGARFLFVQGVHHDNYDMWDSRYTPWNSVRLGARRDFVGEWRDAVRAAGMRFGVTFHHEYTWWWWQTAFGSDATGPKAGAAYDGHLTLADGVGKWWEGMDPRLLYTVDLRSYEKVYEAAVSPWSPPPAGEFNRHRDYAKWYATWWALRMMDVIEKYDPDFVYTDGTGQQPFSGEHTGTGLKADAMQRVIAHLYNRSLQRRGKVDTFSIVKFRHTTNGTVNTEEFGVPAEIKTDQAWIAEAPVGDWFWGPGFTYDAGMMVRYIVEAAARDGSAVVCVSPKPDGELEAGAVEMLAGVGRWMRVNGRAIYSSKAWVKPGEGEMVKGKLKMLPGGKLGRQHRDFKFGTSDFRFTVGADGALYAICMTVPGGGARLDVKSLGTGGGLLKEAVKSVKLLGYDGEVRWTQTAEALEVEYPVDAPKAEVAVVLELR